MQDHWRTAAIAAAGAAVRPLAEPLENDAPRTAAALRRPLIHDRGSPACRAMPFGSPVPERSGKYRPTCCTARFPPTSATVDGSNGGAKRKGAATRKS